jgi:hypothetical protein
VGGGRWVVGGERWEVASKESVVSRPGEVVRDEVVGGLGERGSWSCQSNQ